MAIREQENHTLPIPNGWFAVDWSRELHEGDEFLGMFRKWVRQFYTDPA